jgi:uncharacterized membrane protein
MANDAPIFAARLTPHRSLSRRGAIALVGAVCAIWAVMSLSFLSMGAWPVLMFFGLDIVLLGWLVWLNMREGRRYEDISVSRLALDVRRYSANGLRRERHSFNPLGTRLQIDRHAEFGVMKLTLANRERAITIGDFLNPDDKESFAKAFSVALAKARR